VALHYILNSGRHQQMPMLTGLLGVELRWQWVHRSRPFAAAVGAERCWADVLMDRELIEGRINAICDYKGRKASATRCVEIQNLSLTTRPLRTVAC